MVIEIEMSMLMAMAMVMVMVLMAMMMMMMMMMIRRRRSKRRIDARNLMHQRVFLISMLHVFQAEVDAAQRSLQELGGKLLSITPGEIVCHSQSQSKLTTVYVSRRQCYYASDSIFRLSERLAAVSHDAYPCPCSGVLWQRRPAIHVCGGAEAEEMPKEIPSLPRDPEEIPLVRPGQCAG